MKRSILLILVMLLAVSIMSQVVAAEKYTIATIVKLDGVAWFDRMREGVEQFANDTGHDAYQIGPAKADAAQQVKMIEDLIAQGVDAITVVPNSVETLEPVLKKARAAGIIVIGHEGSNFINVDYDIEAFKNDEYGAHFMDKLAELMGGEGKYAAFVGGLTAKSHNEWVDGAIARAEEKYPNIQLATERIEAFEDSKIAYEKTKELLKAHPDIKGIQGSASTDAPGAALAIEELGLEDRINVVGTSLVSVSGQYLSSGAADMISFWDPAMAGYVMNKVAVMLLEGKSIEDGMDLEVEGYENVSIKDKVIYGQAWVDVTVDNMDQYDF